MFGLSKKVVGSALVLGASCLIVSCGSTENPDVGPSKIEYLPSTVANNDDIDGDISNSSGGDLFFATVDPGDWNVNIPVKFKEAIFRSGVVCNNISPNFIVSYASAVSGFDEDKSDVGDRKGVMQLSDTFMSDFGTDLDGDGVVSALNPNEAINAFAEYGCSQATIINDELAKGNDSMISNFPAMIYFADYTGEDIEPSNVEEASELISAWQSRFIKEGIHFVE